RAAERKTCNGLQGNSSDDYRLFDGNDELGGHGDDGRISRTVSEQHHRGKAQPHAEHRRGSEHMDEFQREDDVEHGEDGSANRSAGARVHAQAGQSRAMLSAQTGAAQNGISSSMSPRSEPPAATAAFRVGPGEPKPFSSEG